jgi:simple sugar transport system ATP-binding protein
MEIRFNQVVKKIKSDTALAGVDFLIPDSGVTAILGDYGSGKSTVLSLITGYLQPDSGEIFIDQSKYRGYTVPDAINEGIGSVDPNLYVYADFSLRENLRLNPRYRADLQDQIEADFSAVCNHLNIAFDFDHLLGTFPVRLRLIFEIIRLYVFGMKLIVLDEPFKHFQEEQKKTLVDLFGFLAQKDTQVIFSTQFVTETNQAADYCVFLKKGKVIGEFNQPFSQFDELVKIDFSPQTLPDFSEYKLLSLIDLKIFPQDEKINYHLRGGEIVGVYCENQTISDNLLLCCAGLHKPYRGEMILNGFDLYGRPLEEFVKDGVVYIAADHLEGNLIPDLSLMEHFGLMGEFSEKTFQPPKFMADATKLLAHLGINRDWRTPVKNLSRVDRIKFLFGVLPKKLSLLICIDPTAGLDLETKQWVWKEIELRAKSGIGVLVYASNQAELLAHTHTIWLHKAGGWMEPIEADHAEQTLNTPSSAPIFALDEEHHAAQ